MNNITKIDKIIIYLKKKNNFVTIHDISNDFPIIDDIEVEKILEHLVSKNFINKDSNSYSINIEGSLFIEETPFFLRNRPFFYKKAAKNIKISVLFVNATALFVLSILSVLNKDTTEHKIFIDFPSIEKTQDEYSKKKKKIDTIQQKINILKE